MKLYQVSIEDRVDLIVPAHNLLSAVFEGVRTYIDTYPERGEPTYLVVHEIEREVNGRVNPADIERERIR